MGIVEGRGVMVGWGGLVDVRGLKIWGRGLEVEGRGWEVGWGSVVIEGGGDEDYWRVWLVWLWLYLWLWLWLWIWLLWWIISFSIDYIISCCGGIGCWVFNISLIWVWGKLWWWWGVF